MGVTKCSLLFYISLLALNFVEASSRHLSQIPPTSCSADGIKTNENFTLDPNFLQGGDYCNDDSQSFDSLPPPENSTDIDAGIIRYDKCLQVWNGWKSQSVVFADVCTFFPSSSKYLCAFRTEVHNNCRRWVKTIWFSCRNRKLKGQESLFNAYVGAFMFNLKSISVNCNSWWTCACPTPFAVPPVGTAFFEWAYFLPVDITKKRVSKNWAPYNLTISGVKYALTQPDPYWSYYIYNSDPFKQHWVDNGYKPWDVRQNPA